MYTQNQIQTLADILKENKDEPKQNIINQIKNQLNISTDDINIKINPFTRSLTANIILSNETTLEFRVSKFKKATAEVKIKF